MKVTKLIAVGTLFLAMAGTVSAQSRTEKTVEEDYLSSFEDVMIAELTASPEYEMKNLALQYLENAVNEGRTTPDMVSSLKSLAGEGVTKRSRTNGRLMNNYPDVRKKACELLGQVGTEDAKNTLVQIIADEQEPMVAAAAVHALGDIGLNESDEVVGAIIFMQRRYDALNPSSSLALELLFAYEKLADTVQDRRPMLEAITNIATNYRLATAVRTKAYNLIRDIQSK